jgi:hypothetical protein
MLPGEPLETGEDAFHHRIAIEVPIDSREALSIWGERGEVQRGEVPGASLGRNHLLGTNLM